jgi:predicted nucleic acid-binding protein
LRERITAFALPTACRARTCTAANERAAIYRHQLLYSISRDPAEASKRDITIALLDADDIALSVQVLQEFYVQATRATRPDSLSLEIAVGLVRAWLRFTVQEITLPVMVGALEIKAIYRLPHWDAAIVAAARALGCRELLSEDMSHGREIDSITITNPFRWA